MSKAKSVKKPADPFQSSAVITRKRLHDDHHEALSIAPRWAKLGGLVRDEDDMETADNVGAELVGKKYSRIDKLPPVGQAVVYELTRYGGNVTTQVNRPKGAVSSRIKLTKSRSLPHGALPSGIYPNRLFANAKAGEAMYVGEDRSDHRSTAYRKGKARSQTRNARADAMLHAETCARRFLAGDLVTAYLHNLHDLFDLFDELEGIKKPDKVA